MAKAEMTDITPDEFGIVKVAEEITAAAFAETEKLRRAGLLSGSLIAKMLADKPAFEKAVRKRLDGVRWEIEEFYIKELKRAQEPKTVTVKAIKK